MLTPEVCYNEEVSQVIEARTIVVEKGARTLALVESGRTVARFPVLVGGNPGPKKQEGDGRTPEGHYFVLRLLADEAAAGVGYYKGLHISYPEVKDAERAYLEGRIGDDLLRRILKDYATGTIPPQESLLGGYVAIHAGLAPDEPFERGTKGCIVMRNADMDSVYAFAQAGTPVLIVP